jgi:hypothetical protein
MAIESVERILGRPAAPQEVPGANAWVSVESELGTTLPDDYKAFIESFGTGTIDEFVVVFNPFSRNKFVNLLERGRVELQAYRQLKGGHYVHEVFPSPGGLLPFASTDNGNVFYWKTSGSPNWWTVVVYEARGPKYYEFKGGMAEFLTAVLTRAVKCDVLPRDFPSDRPAFVPIPVSSSRV